MPEDNDIAKAIRDSSPSPVPAGDPSLERARRKLGLNRVEAAGDSGYGRLGGDMPATPPNRSGASTGRTVAIAAAALLMATGIWKAPALLSPATVTRETVKISTSTDSRLTVEALEAIEQPGMVTYYRVLLFSREQSGPPRQVSEQEYWADNANDRFKIVTRAPDERTGAPGVLRRVVYRSNGKQTSKERGMPWNYFSGPAPNRSEDELEQATLKYRRMLEDGEVQRLGEEKLFGMPTLKILVLENKFRISREQFAAQAQVVNIRKDNKRPVRIKGEYVIFGPDGIAGRLGETQTLVFKDVRLLDPKSLASDFFAPQLPETDYYLDERLSPSELRKFSNYDLFYLGESYKGLRPEDKFTGHVVEVDRSGRHTVEQVHFSYSDGQSPPDRSLFINIEPLTKLNDISFFEKNLRASHARVKVKGAPALLIKLRKKGPYILRFQRGDASLRLVSSNKELLLEAAGDLVQLNVRANNAGSGK